MAKSTELNTAGESTEQDLDDLPQPPPLRRRLQIAPLQLIGVPLLALLPLMAMLGLFDEQITHVKSSNETLVLQVDYASFHRYKVQDHLTAAVTLLSAESPTTVTKAMNQERVPPEEIYSAMRESGIDKLSKVRWAILEPDGKISIIPEEIGASGE